MCVCRETAGLRAVIPEEQASLHMLEQLEKLAKETEAAAQVPVYIFLRESVDKLMCHYKTCSCVFGQLS